MRHSSGGYVAVSINGAFHCSSKVGFFFSRVLADCVMRNAPLKSAKEPHLSMTPGPLPSALHAALQADGAPRNKVLDLHTHPATHVPNLQDTQRWTFMAQIPSDVVSFTADFERSHILHIFGSWFFSPDSSGAASLRWLSKKKPQITSIDPRKTVYLALCVRLLLGLTSVPTARSEVWSLDSCRVGDGVMIAAAHCCCCCCQRVSSQLFICSWPLGISRSVRTPRLSKRKTPTFVLFLIRRKKPCIELKTIRALRWSRRCPSATTLHGSVQSERTAATRLISK